MPLHQPHHFPIHKHTIPPPPPSLLTSTLEEKNLNNDDLITLYHWLSLPPLKPILVYIYKNTPYVTSCLMLYRTHLSPLLARPHPPTSTISNHHPHPNYSAKQMLETTSPNPSLRREGCRSVGRDLSYLKKKKTNQNGRSPTYLNPLQTNPHPHPSTIYNIPIEKKTHIAYIDNLKQPYERATAGLSSQAVVYLIFFKQSCRNSKSPPKKQKATKKTGESR